MNRREFSQLIAGMALIQAIPRGHAESAPPPGRFRFSVMLPQLEKKETQDRSIEIIAATGYQGVELTNQFKKWSPEETRRVKAKMHSLGLVFDAIDGGKFTLTDATASSTIISELTATIATVKDLGCSQLILTSGKRIPGASEDAERTAIIDNLKRIADLVTRNDMQAVIEPIDLIENRNAYLNSVVDGFEIVRAVGSPNVKVLYDFYHEQRGGGNLIEKLEKNIDLIGLVHIADVPGRHEPGTGEINYINIYRKLAELRYERYIAMEFSPTGDPVEILKKARLDAQQAEQGAPSV